MLDVISLIGAVVSIVGAIISIFQYKNTKRVRAEFEQKVLDYNKAQFRSRIDEQVRLINENKKNPQKLKVGGKLDCCLSQIFSEIRSCTVYNDESVSCEIRNCETALKSLSDVKSFERLKECLCDLSRAIDESVRLK